MTLSQRKFSKVTLLQNESNMAPKFFTLLAVLCMAVCAYADAFSDDFDSYNPPLAGPPGIALAGLGGWVTGEANGTTTSAGVRYYCIVIKHFLD